MFGILDFSCLDSIQKKTLKKLSAGKIFGGGFFWGAKCVEFFCDVRWSLQLGFCDEIPV